LFDEFTGQNQFDHEANQKDEKLKKIDDLLKRSSLNRKTGTVVGRALLSTT
jgi:hypothetical protein